ncbi:MAG: hypothetical protein M1824_003514 [Vezdaea acicularis]|nr:MAG: hypothetical protein M1824_003514 [Vezdaea acicularis]
MPGKGSKDDDIPHLENGRRPGNGNHPVPSQNLPRDLQKIVDREETLWDEVVEGYAPESTDSNIRYAAYASRIRTALISAQRYVAYTSDIGESFRPIAHPNLVRTAYGISWAYLVGDVGHEGYKAYCRNQRILHPVKFAESLNKEAGAQLHDVTQLSPGVVPALEDYRTIMVQRALFQGIASMGLPAFTIHSIVRYSTRALKSAKSSTVRAYVPIGLGLAAVPFLPFVFDKPVEEAVEWTFHKAFEAYGGEKAVKHSPPKIKEKEL